MKTRQNIDERQRQEKGKIFEQSFILLLFLLLVNACLYGILNIVWADFFASQIIIIIAGCSFCTIRMIWKDAYNEIDSSKINPVLVILGAAGFVGVCSNVIIMIRRNTGFVAVGKLTSDGVGTLIAGGMLSIGIAHLIKVYKDKKADWTEDE